MCELLAMSSKLPTNLNLSLHEFARHGGEIGPHRDGWGIAYAMGRDYRIIKEPEPAAGSDCVRYIEQHRFSSHTVISHIRRASIPKVQSFENTHPFDRELFGRRFLFAHNGELVGLEGLEHGVEPRFRPLGTTDSERAFCLILNRLSERVAQLQAYTPAVLADLLLELSPRLLALGKCNFLLSDSEYLFAHGDNSLHWITRECEAQNHTFAGGDLRVSMSHEGPQQATLVATVPLTDHEPWQRFARGELRAFAQGRDLSAELGLI